jgi:hypothetical protein
MPCPHQNAGSKIILGERTTFISFSLTCLTLSLSSSNYYMSPPPPPDGVPEIFHLHLPPFLVFFCIILLSEVMFYPQIGSLELVLWPATLLTLQYYCTTPLVAWSLPLGRH